MSAPVRPIAVIAAIAAIEGLGLLGYALFDLIQSLRTGVTGPSDVSNVPAVIVQIVIQTLFGAGLLWVARGWWTRKRWARAPFLVAQILAVLVGYDLVQSVGTTERTVGIVFAVLATIGIVLVFLPGVAREIEP